MRFLYTTTSVLRINPFSSYMYPVNSRHCSLDVLPAKVIDVDNESVGIGADHLPHFVLVQALIALCVCVCVCVCV